MTDERIYKVETQLEVTNRRFDGFEQELRAQTKAITKISEAIQQIALVVQRQDHLEEAVARLRSEFDERRRMTDPVIMDAEKVKSEVLTRLNMIGVVAGALQVVVLASVSWLFNELATIRESHHDLETKVAEQGHKQ